VHRDLAHRTEDLATGVISGRTAAPAIRATTHR
jgi:hypothetical protein